QHRSNRRTATRVARPGRTQVPCSWEILEALRRIDPAAAPTPIRSQRLRGTGAFWATAAFRAATARGLGKGIVIGEIAVEAPATPVPPTTAAMVPAHKFDALMPLERSLRQLGDRRPGRGPTRAAKNRSRGKRQRARAHP